MTNTMISSQGIFLFTFVTTAVVFIQCMKRVKGIVVPSDDRYMATLKKLFQFTSKTPSRHSGSELSTLERFQLRKAFFLEKCFDSPVLKRAKIIHVAGTKGKGSTVEYISAGLRYLGVRKVGVFTSPHLHTARERVKVGTNLISKENVIRLGEEALAQLSSVSWAVFFDTFVVLAMNYFREQEVDYIVMEAGIGGRYDSTNFIDTSEVSVITSISLDHQALLGETIEEIAWQKAGIIKCNGNVFTSEAQEAVVIDVLRKQCLEMNATLHIVPVSREKVEILGLSTSYSVQIQNACLSMAVLEFLNVPTEGLKDFFWPCRMETFLIDDVTVVLDGCHNDHSVEQFMLGLKKRYPDCHLQILFGAGMEKYLSDMLRHLFDHANSVLMVQSRHFKSLSELDLIGAVKEDDRCLLQKFCSNVSSESGLSSDDRDSVGAVANVTHVSPPIDRREDGSVSERLLWSMEHARSERACSGKQVIVAVCGSLFAASEAREVLFSKSPASFHETDWVRFADEFY